MKINEFQRALKQDDFAIGDSFWIGNWEFEVVNKIGADDVGNNKTVFKWELTRQEFAQLIRDNYPEIKNAEKFLDEYEDDIIHYFEKGFDVLVGECGATYKTIINNGIAEVLK